MFFFGEFLSLRFIGISDSKRDLRKNELPELSTLHEGIYSRDLHGLGMLRKESSRYDPR